jgi:hypothetical protein
VRSAIGRVLARRGLDIGALDPWYFPTAEEYAGKLAARGFAIDHLVLFPRPTALPGELRGWLETFAKAFMAPLTPEDRPAFLAEVEEDCRPDLRDAAGKWTADYTRLRFSAVKPA